MANGLKPTAILVVTAEVAKPRFSGIRAKLVEYVKNGGTLIYCGHFTNFIRPPTFDEMMQSDWNLPWTFGDYHRSTFALSPTRHARLQGKPLPPKYSMKAVQIKGAAADDAVYVTTEDSVVESRVFSPRSVHGRGQYPILFKGVGEGYLGYMGDVNPEEEDTPVILAMCGISA